jgi:hypothetical protein
MQEKLPNRKGGMMIYLRPSFLDVNVHFTKPWNTVISVKLYILSIHNQEKGSEQKQENLLQNSIFWDTESIDVSEAHVAFIFRMQE